MPGETYKHIKENRVRYHFVKLSSALLFADFALYQDFFGNFKAMIKLGFSFSLSHIYRCTTSTMRICLKKNSSFSRSKKECPFVLEKKGKEFVEDCQVRRQQLEKSFLLT